MGLVTYAMLLFGISIAFFFIGSAPPMFAAVGCDTTLDTCTPSDTLGTEFLNSIIDMILNNPMTALLGAVAIVTAVLIGGSFVVIYLIPALLLMVAANFFLLPTSFLFTDALPFEIRVIVLGFLNLMLIMTIITFVRGGE